MDKEQRQLMMPIINWRCPHVLLASMALLQGLWLAAIWLTGAAPRGWQGKMVFLIAYTLVAGVTVSLLPSVFLFKLGQIKSFLVQNEKRLILILITSVLAVAAFYAVYQRVLTDEARLWTASRLVAEKGLSPFFASYVNIQWLGRQHPPLMPLFLGMAMSLLGTDLFVLRLISILFTAATVLLTYALGAELYDRETGLLAAVFLLSFPYFLRMGSAAQTDVPVTFFFTLALFLTQRLARRPTFPLAVAAGASIVAGLLTKYTMALVCPIMLGYFVINGSVRRLRAYLAVLGLVCGGLLAAWLVYAYSSGILAVQSNTIAAYLGVATSSSGGIKWAIEMLSTRLTSAIGVYNFPVIGLSGLCLTKCRTKPDWFILLWTAIVFLTVTLTLPDARYFMPAFPALGIAMARAGVRHFFEAPEKVALLALLYCGGALYLLVDWYRASYIFLQH
jgi:4-amino-4-deoxy-L-arabinose transferase-like glycosyltransferase